MNSEIAAPEVEEIEIDPEFESVCRKQTEDEKAEFRRNIEKDGYRDPLVVWHDGDRWLLLDGHHRLRLWKMYHENDPDYLPGVCVKSLPDRAAAIIWIVRNQLARRNLLAVERIELAKRLEPEIREKAKANQSHGETAPGRNASGKNAKSVPVNVRETVAEIAGVSERTLHNHKVVMDSDDEELKDDVRAGRKSIGGAAKSVRQRRAESQQQEARENPWPDDERELKERLDQGETIVVNVNTMSHLMTYARDNDLLVMVDRSSKWGNPFVLGDDGDREEVCEKYANHYLPLKNTLQSMLPGLRGKALGCHCAPKQCHGHELARLANDS